MKSKIDIVILTPGFAADETDTTAFPSLQLFLAKLKSCYPGINLHMVTFHYPFRRGYYEWKGIPVYAAGGVKWKPFKIFLWARILLHLFKLNKEHGIDVIHAFWLADTALTGLLFGRLAGVRVLTTTMGQDIKKQNRYLGLIRPFKPDIITISEFQAAFIPENFKTFVRGVIPFGIDPQYFSQKQEARPIDILAVGSLNTIKNYPDFVQVISSLAGVYPTLKCGIAGEGDQREEIERLISVNGLEKTITLFGELPYEEVILKMQRSKILLHTSTFEGQALVITEALASGAYVVSYPVGTAWAGTSGKLMTGSSTEELKKHVCVILDDQEPDYSPVILFTIEDTCYEYFKIYSNLVAATADDYNAESNNSDTPVL